MGNPCERWVETSRKFQNFLLLPTWFGVCTCTHTHCLGCPEPFQDPLYLWGYGEGDQVRDPQYKGEWPLPPLPPPPGPAASKAGNFPTGGQRAGSCFLCSWEEGISSPFPAALFPLGAPLHLATLKMSFWIITGWSQLFERYKRGPGSLRPRTCSPALQAVPVLWATRGT